MQLFPTVSGRCFTYATVTSDAFIMELTDIVFHRLGENKTPKIYVIFLAVTKTDFVNMLKINIYTWGLLRNQIELK